MEKRYHGNVTSWMEVSERRLTENYCTALDILKRESGARVAPALLGVIKANAYGHGAAICAPVLARAGAEWLGVTDAAEGAAVRLALGAAGIEADRQPRILVMCGHLPDDAPTIIEHRLVPAVWSQVQLTALAEAADAIPAPVHLEIDTGMSRQGVAVGDELRELLRWLRGQSRLRLDGVMTHFASAEVVGSEQTQAQQRQFEVALRIVAEEGLVPRWIHAGNTSILDNPSGASLAWLSQLAESRGARAMAREGLGLYGYCLPLERTVQQGGGTSRLRAFAHPVMTWKTRVLSLSEVQPGTRIGYNGTFLAERRMRLALLPVGYADGLRRELSGSGRDLEGCSTWNTGGWVMFHGRRAPIAGRISMNLTTVDVTDLHGIEVGDEAVLLGEGITADDHAVIAGTIAYEILCGIRAPGMLV